MGKELLNRATNSTNPIPLVFFQLLILNELINKTFFHLNTTTLGLKRPTKLHVDGPKFLTDALRNCWL